MIKTLPKHSHAGLQNISHEITEHQSIALEDQLNHSSHNIQGPVRDGNKTAMQDRSLESYHYKRKILDLSK